MPSYYHLVGLAVTGTVLLILGRTLFYLIRYPAAPGSRLARITPAWYWWKVWEGRFETWNIEQHAKNGKVIRVAPNMYSIDDPEAAKILYGTSRPWRKSKWYETSGDPRIPNHNLFSAVDVETHARMRRFAANLYTMTAIKSYEPFVGNCVMLLLEQLDERIKKGGAIDLQRWMQFYAFDVVSEITYGRRLGFLEAGGHDFENVLANLDVTMAFSTLAGLDLKLIPLLRLKLGNPIPGMLAWTARLSKLRDTPAERRYSSSQPAEDFFSKLEKLRKADPRSYEENRGEVLMTTNVMAGSDTTSIALTSILYHLIKSPETYLKLRQEILKATARGEADQPITFDQAQKLPYLQAVTKEGMRLHPSTGLPMWRVVPSDGATIADTFFPPGTILGINTWVAHRNTDIFGPDAAEWRPERWLPEVTPPEMLARMGRYFIPFGAGTRTCSGKNISILEMNKVIPELVRRYDFELLSQEYKTRNMWFVKQKDLQVLMKHASLVKND